MGRKRLHKQEMKWSEDNPTLNYCYVISEWVHRYFAPDGSQSFRVEVPGDPYGHRFNVWPDGSIVDLGAEQFGEQEIPYHEARPFTFMKSGGSQPSWRAQMLQHVYMGRPVDEFVAAKDGRWRDPQSPKDLALELLKDWTDPYPPLQLTEHDGFTVVREDALRFGSKARFVDALVSLHPEIDEWVFGSCPAQGWAQVSLTEVCNRHGKKAHYFMAQRSEQNYTAEQKTGLMLGGDYHWVPNGMLPVTQARAREFVEQSPTTRMVLPIGLEHPFVFAAIIKTTSALKTQPSELWSVASSGSLSRGLQMAFPKATVHAVSVGHKMSDRETGRAKLWRSPLKFEHNIPDGDRPPYPSVSNYDAKVWPFVRDHATEGAWVWNVAADLDPTITSKPHVGLARDDAERQTVMYLNDELSLF